MSGSFMLNMEQTAEPPVAKRTTSEQRKLRSRDAARCRRSQETEVFYELAHTLPLPRRVTTHLDKAAIMRVTLSYLRMQNLLQADENQKDECKDRTEEDEDPMNPFYLEVLAGFVMVMTEEGDMIYLSENVSKHIGITQLELLGQSVYDFVHPCDQEELRDLVTPRPGLNKNQLSELNFFLRMKSTMTSRGRTVNIKSATWKVLHCTGHMRQFGGGATSLPAAGVVTLLCEPIPHPSSVEFPLDSNTFLTRHSMDLCFTHCEGRVTELVGYKSEDLIGHSAYEFHHALDSIHIKKSLLTLLTKGQVRTSRYRFLVNNGGFVWVETQATVLYSNKTSQPEAIVCLNFILSAVEQPDVIFSAEQVECGQTLKVEPQSPAAVEETFGISDGCDSDSSSERVTDSSQSLGAAACDDDAAELFNLKDQQEELPQLAPEAGDAVVSLTVVELSFAKVSSPDMVPDCPEKLCTPQLRKLLSPIFNTSSSSSPAVSSESCQVLSPLDDGVMDTSMVKFFATCPEEGQTKDGETQEGFEAMDLDMLAPYISMDDDFQLIFNKLPEDSENPFSSSWEPSSGAPAAELSRKRTRSTDEEILCKQTIQDKRQRPSPSSPEEPLLSQTILECVEEAEPCEVMLQKRSQLLTDRDPVLGSVHGLCDTAALISVFSARPPDPRRSFSPMT
ncbi:hypoxia inducible factor 1 subunit alpha, like isoform X2 [Thalassophryne amazonica]|uniref:hypoxia inducible factor 1 subunit alpha, like isoform X2 n=1 Tax=Thalassophryne amazonica TaxID=390379 RepID=UPI0014720AA2|nr:hypoxia inducible factor 1 subunit alpha, like isoform X2 [Thalassophryne amazonica]